MKCISVGLGKVFVICMASLFLVLSVRADGPPPAAQARQMLDDYFRRETALIGMGSLADGVSRQVWERRRPALRRQFLDMLGLWPLPPRTDLRAVVTGKIETERFVVEKLHFQSIPGLYVTANLYVPKLTKFPAPAVLYVCGHAPSVVNGVPHGNKVSYQHHAIWFAEHGYVCLVVDTLQLGEIPGEHHGTHNKNYWWWQALGYTPAGIECWNAMRALDYLETRPEVDAGRIGVTGRSGGGATSWWLAAADDRPQCIIPVAGIADLEAHVVAGAMPPYQKGVISGHCDCMYFINTYQWDFADVAALCAPRPLMLGNSDRDAIFPLKGYRRLADKVRKIYDLYGAGDRFVLLETAGPHKDTPELRLGAYRWLGRWLYGAGEEASEVEPARFSPAELKVFTRTPDDALNSIIHEVFLKQARPQLPSVDAVVRAWWPEQKDIWLMALEDRSFRGWPRRPVPLDAQPQAEEVAAGNRILRYTFSTDHSTRLRLEVSIRKAQKRPAGLLLCVLDDPQDRSVLAMGPGVSGKPATDVAASTSARSVAKSTGAVNPEEWALAFFEPRGSGSNQWTKSGTSEDHHIRRRFALLGQTLDGMRVWDVRRAIRLLRNIPDLKDVPIWLAGKGNMAGIALYAAIFEPAIAGLHLHQPPHSHRQGPIFLNVLRILDMPQAVALAFPRQIQIFEEEKTGKTSWEWPLELQRSLGAASLKIERPRPFRP